MFQLKLIRKWKDVPTNKVSDFAPVQSPLNNSSESNSLEQNDWGSNIEEDLKGRFSSVEYVINYLDLEDLKFLLMNFDMEVLITLKLDLRLVEISAIKEVSWDGDSAGVELSLFWLNNPSYISSVQV